MQKKICVVGLGYVGLPLSVALSKSFSTVGYDISESRIRDLQHNLDRTNELTSQQLAGADSLTFTCNTEDIKNHDVYIITVPTPVDRFKKPDMSYLLEASQRVGMLLKSGDLVIYESTVYPGATEEYCVPILEQNSGLTLNKDFGVGYSPERINPGDRKNTILEITKVTSGSSDYYANIVDEIYSTIITAGTHKAPSIRVAEAAKVIENTQRDVNIALMNELSVLFNKMGINTYEVLAAAGTKWNFLNFTPGLVGGHCIGVDPYYLTHKALEYDHTPELILAGRRMNDSMAKHVAIECIKNLNKSNIQCDSKYKILILGLAFKENCPDIRNTKIVDLMEELLDFGAEVSIHDPIVDVEIAKEAYGINLITEPKFNDYHSVILAVPHEIFKSEKYMPIEKFACQNALILDLKNSLKISDRYWTL